MPTREIVKRDQLRLLPLVIAPTRPRGQGRRVVLLAQTAATLLGLGSTLELLGVGDPRHLSRRRPANRPRGMWLEPGSLRAVNKVSIRPSSA